MRLLKKYALEIVVLSVLVIIYLFLRLAYLDSLPIFTDEAIYVRWAQIALGDASWRFISLTDGKQPLFIWFVMVFMKFMEDPLIAGRLVSVVAGMFTFFGLFFLTRELFKKREIALFASALYVFYPFSQVYDRMALYDGVLGAFTVWGIYFSVLLVRRLRLDIAYTLGFIMGGAILNKSSGIFLVYLLPLTLILRDLKTVVNKSFLIKFIALGIFAYLLSQGFYSVLRLSPFLQIVTEKNAIFVFPFSEWINHPFLNFAGNLKGLSGWIFTYLTPAYLLLIFLAFLKFRDFWREKVFLIIYFLIPFVALALFGRVIFPRFIYFMSLSLIPLAAYGLNFLTEDLAKRLDKKYKTAITLVLIVVFVAYPAKVSWDFAANPLSANIAQADKDQYVASWPAGWGVIETVEYFKKISPNEKVFIATEGSFGLLPHALEIFLIDNNNIEIKGYWPVGDELPPDVLEKSKLMPSYFVFYQPTNSKLQENSLLELVLEKQIGDSEYFFRVYKINARI